MLKNLTASAYIGCTGVSGLVTRVSNLYLSRCRFDSHCGPFASNLEQVANL